MFMLVLLGIIFCIGFFIYKLGREKGERTVREKMQLHDLQQANDILHRNMTKSIASQRERSIRTQAIREASHHNHNKALAAGVIGAAAGAALMHHHDESNLQRRLDQPDGMQRAGGDIPYSDLDEVEHYDSDDMDYGDNEMDDSDGYMKNDVDDDVSDQDGFDDYGAGDSNDFSDDYENDDDDGDGF